MSPLSRPCLLALLLTLGAWPACDTEGAGPADDDDTSVDLTLAASYQHTAVYDIEPNETGQTLGLSPCSITLTGTLTEAAEAPTCPDCDATYAGPVTSNFTNCSSVDIDDSFTYGLAMPAGGEIEIWSPGETDWRLLGTAVESGNVYELSTTEEMGDETFSLGTMDSLLTLE